jgi:hypothetical protein
VLSTSFAVTREGWETFGPIRGRLYGDVALGQYFQDHGLTSVYPVMPRVKDVGMLHPEGFSVVQQGSPTFGSGRTRF